MSPFTVENNNVGEVSLIVELTDPGLVGDYDFTMTMDQTLYGSQTSNLSFQVKVDVLSCTSEDFIMPEIEESELEPFYIWPEVQNKTYVFAGLSSPCLHST